MNSISPALLMRMCWDWVMNTPFNPYYLFWFFFINEATLCVL
jgi:hypothetical protein